MPSVRQIVSDWWSNYARMGHAIAFFCLALIAIVWTVTVDRIRFERASTISRAVKNTSNLAIAYEEHTIRTLKDVDHVLLFIQDQYAEHGLKFDIPAMLKKGTVDTNLFKLVGVIDRHGDRVLGSSESKSINARDREYFSIHETIDNKQMYIGKPLMGRVSGKWIIPISRRINNPDGSFGGIVYAAVDPDYFTSVYRKADLGDHGLATLVGTDGIVRARRLGQRATFGQDMRGTTLFAEQAKRDVGSYVSKGVAEGVRRFISYRALQEYPLIVTVGVSEDEALSAFYDRRNSHYVWAVLATLFVGMFAAGLVIAVSRQERSLRALAESETRFRSLTQLSSDWYWEQDANFRFTDLIGNSLVRSEFVTGKTRWEVPNVVLTAAEWDEHKRLLESRKPFRDVVMKQLDDDGKLHFVSVSGEPMFGCDGAFHGYQGTAKDITEQKLTEEHLSKLSRAVEQSPASTVITDTDGRIEYVNPKFCAVTGYAADELIGKTPAVIKSGLTPLNVYRDLWRTILSGGEWRGEIQNRKRDGTLYWEHIIISPLKDDEGKIIRFIGVKEDITARRHAEAVIQESEARYRSLFDNMQEGLAYCRMMFDGGRPRDFVYIDVNPAFEKLTGLRNVVGKYVSEVIPGIRESNPELFAVYARVAATGRPEKLETYVKALDVWLSISVYSTEEQYFVALFHNITERRRIEEQQARLVSIIEATPDLVATVTPDRRLLYCNDAGRRMIGLPADAVLAEFRISEVYPEWANKVVLEQGLPTALSTGTWSGETALLTRQGHEIPVIQVIIAHKGPNGELEYLSTIMRDITDRKAAEERFRATFEQAAVGIAHTTFDHRYLMVNQKFCDVLGYTRDELLTMYTSQLPHPEDRGDGSDMKRLLAGEITTYAGEKRYMRKDGTALWVNRTISLARDRFGKPLYCIRVVEDISERKRGEAELQQARLKREQTQRELREAQEKLADAARLESVGRLAAGVAHEVKNPLTIIRLGSDFLARKIAPGEDNALLLNDIHSAIDRADKVIGELLDFSRQKRLTRSRTDITEVIDSALHLLNHEIELRNIKIVTHYSDALPAILADPDRLLQVFVNLITNAVQAIGRDGTVEVITRVTNVSEHDLQRHKASTFRHGERVIIAEVRDTGPGVSVQHEKRLFEPFFTTKSMGEGTGLGLAVSRNIVVMHGGSISISNRPEGGASAIVMFRTEDRQELIDEEANTGSR